MMQNLPWLFLVLPLVAAAADWLLLARRPRMAAGVSITSVLATLVLCIACMCGLQTGTPADYTWFPVQGIDLSLGLLIDALSIKMMLVVTGIGALVHIFSLGYMKGDPSNHSRYFAGLSIFMFSMSCIVLANSLVLTFIGWEMVGFSSYLLIGHWYHKETAADAAKKAFITNRVGDFGFLIGIMLTLGLFGSLHYADMAGHMKVAAGSPVLTAAILFLFCGAVGKSAQFPLHVWLPDAMEGPTPVSALIHAATMVAAGVYMLVRLQVSMGLYAFTDTACSVIAAIGAITAVLSALMAAQQDDIKRVLAYSTLSQLGYMIMAVGLLAGEAAMFHLYTHAWFKALLFLAAGAIIVCCHHEQNIWKMGGLRQKMPLTVLCFLAGTCALVAVPGFSGFFSKESILEAAWGRSLPLFIVGIVVAAFTTFYMVRLCLVAFGGRARTRDAEQAHEAGPSMLVPLFILAAMAIISGYGFVADRLVPFADFHAESTEWNVTFFAGLGSLIVGGGLAWFMYAKSAADSAQSDPFGSHVISRILRRRLYIDSFYDHLLIGGVQRWFTCLVSCIDDGVIRRLVGHGLALLTAWTGRLLSRIQGGSLRGYTVVASLGVFLLILLLIILF